VVGAASEVGKVTDFPSVRLLMLWSRISGVVQAFLVVTVSVTCSRLLLEVSMDLSR